MNVLRACCLAAGLSAALAGCKSRQIHSGTPAIQTPPATVTKREPKVVPPLEAVDYQEPLPHPIHDPGFTSPSEIFETELSRDWLAAQVEARNPTLEAMAAAWQAAAQIYPQRVALDDPVLMGMLAPGSVGAATTETAYAFQLNQKVPWLGKRALRGEMANADADAAYQDVEDSRLQVRLAADLAFFEYYLAARLLEINSENSRLMQEYQQSAREKYRTNQVTQQDVLQAEFELADLARRELELQRIQQVAVARINTLLRRWPDAPLPPPPAKLDSPGPPEDKTLAWQMALQQRPDLAALAWRVQAAEAALALAQKSYCPDFDTFARYDTWWQPASTQGPLRAQIGVAMNLPVYRQKLHAAVCEAQFRLNQRRAEFDARALAVQYEVLAAAEQVEESRKAIGLYNERLIPAAEQNVAAGRTNYEVGKVNFLQLAQTQRQLIAIRERQIEALVAYHRRLAELVRAVAGSPLQP